MWPFKRAIKKESASIAEQIDFFIKALPVQQADPNWKAGKELSRMAWDTDTAIKDGYNAVSIVYAAVEKRAQLQASVPWVAYHNGKAMPNSDLQQLINYPSTDMSWYEMIYHASQMRDLSGDAYLSKVKIGNTTKELSIYPSKNVKAITGKDRPISGYKYKKEFIPADEMIHLKTPAPLEDGPAIYGQPTLMAAGRPADIDKESSNWQKAGLQNRGVMDIQIQVPEGTGEEEVEKIKERWAERQAGGRNARKPIVTSGEIKQFGANAVEMDFVTSRRAVQTEIAAVFGVPMACMGFTDDVNLSNAESMNKQLWENTIIPLLELTKRQLDMQLAADFGKGWELRFDLSNVKALQASLTEKLDNATKLQSLGYTRNEINKRLELGFEEDAAGNIRYEPVGLMPMGAGGTDDEPEPDSEEAKNLKLVAYGPK